MELTILTLNVWGIPFVSSDREMRINAISSELSTGKYDIVSLQEVWSESDYKRLKAKTEAVLPYEHYFYSGVFGAGLLVLSKYPIISTLFHVWSVNGYFHRIQHADWFGGKGVGLCKILVGDKIVNLYNAHLHAEYDNENDEYKTHRVIQAFDTAQFIEETRGNSVLQILAGDLNTQPKDISYKVLLYTSKMEDCCTDDTVATHECQQNSYTSKRVLAKSSLGIRIDHIFVHCSDRYEIVSREYSLPLPERVPGQKYSYSDHEAVQVKLKVKKSLTGLSELTSLPESSNSCLVERTERVLYHSSTDDDVVDEQNASCPRNPSRETAVLNRISVLHESISLCETALQKLKIDRILYYSIAVFIAFLLLALVDYSVPNGFKTLYLLLKFVLFGIILFCTFMASIWNYMERNGVLSGKMSMEIMLRSTEKLELSLN